MRLIDADVLKENCRITGEFINNFEGVSLSTLGDIIDKQPTIDPVKHGKWLLSQNHRFSEDIETRWFESYCNDGVECEICGERICIHCNPKYDEMEDCIPHYVCSECGRATKKREPYCHCGARMDGE